tara:strand:- start:5 stop:583 length:579 start_codon:yes stop_codon:yes gene_type:complete
MFKAIKDILKNKRLKTIREANAAAAREAKELKALDKPETITVEAPKNPIFEEIIEELQNIKEEQKSIREELDEPTEQEPLPPVDFTQIAQPAPAQSVEPIKQATDFNKLIDQFEQINGFREKLKNEILEEMDDGNGLAEKNKSKLIELLAPKLLEMVGTGAGAVPQQQTTGNALDPNLVNTIAGVPKEHIIG